MKRISVFVLAAVMMFGGMVTNAPEAKASGVDVKMRGLFEFAFNNMHNRNFGDSANWGRQRVAGAGADQTGANSQEARKKNDNFEARQRLRIWANFVASENLSGTLSFRIGQTVWGRGAGGGGAVANGNAGGALDADGVNIRVKHVFIDWLVPNTSVSVRMGIQPMALPSIRFGSNVLQADMGGITVSSPITDWLRVTAFWVRPLDSHANTFNANAGFNQADTIGGRNNRWGGLSNNVNTTADFFGLVLPMNFTGVRVSPWAMYGRIGAASGMFQPGAGYAFTRTVAPLDFATPLVVANSTSVGTGTANAWYLGANLNVTILDPLVFGMDMVYGRIGRTDYGGLTTGQAIHDWRDRHNGGPFRGMEASGWYIGATLDYRMSWGTPGIFGWYGSGDSLGGREQGKIGRMPSIMTDSNTFRYSSFGGSGMFGLSQEAFANVTGTGTGNWGVGIQVANVSFVKDLTHVLRFAYVRGTNDAGIPQAVLHDAQFAYGQGGGVNDGRSILPFNQRSLLMWGADALYLTTKDSVFEINFDHQYRIYENLTAALELGYLRLSSDVNTWGSNHAQWARNGHQDGRRHTKGSSNAWKANLMFNYSF